MLQVNALDQVIVKNSNMLDYETSQHFQVKVGSSFLFSKHFMFQELKLF